MEREKQAIHFIAGVMDATRRGDVAHALKLINELEAKFSDTANFMINGAACLIETGALSADPTLVQRGIDLGSRALLTLPEDSECRGTLHFNIGNGYYSLFSLDQGSGKAIDFYSYQPLHNAKSHFRQALSANTLTDDMKRQALVNLANVLDSLGRTVEAIHSYERVLAVDNSFPMAQANLGQALTTFAAICGEYKAATLHQAYSLIKAALSRRSQVLAIGGQSAVDFFEKRMGEIAACFGDRTVLNKPIQHPALNVKRLTKAEQEYYHFCHENRLFLNFHIHMSEVLCAASVVDNIMFSLFGRAPSESSRFVHLAKYVNQMKEDFATARYLFFQSMQTRPHVTRISHLTKYVDTLDFTENSLYLGSAKAAFERAYSVLDKIGAFLNAYLGLQTPKRHVYFRTIWACDRAKWWEVKNAIKQNKKLSLLGLYDVNRDFHTGEYEHISTIRNALVHDRLSLVDEFFLGPRDSRVEETVVAITEFRQRTIDLLLIVKSCITNLVNFV
jgi:tetratricopeptide (TPR) repeat protein